MVSAVPVQGRHRSTASSNMWAVVVLGIVTAVFAWVWFGSRGEKKGSETEGKAAPRSVSARRVQDTEADDLTSAVTTLISDEGGEGDGGTQGASCGNTHRSVHIAEASLVNVPQKGSDVHEDRDVNPVQSAESPAEQLCGEDDSLSAASNQEHITAMDLMSLAREDLLQDSKHVCQLPALQNEVLQASPNNLEASDRAEVYHSTGADKEDLQVNEDPSHSGATNVDLVGPREEVYPSADEKRAHTPLEDWKPSLDALEMLTGTTEEQFVAPDKVVAVSAKMGADLTSGQNDGFKLMNGSEEHVEKESAKVSLQDNALNITDSPKQVRPINENHFDLHDQDQLESSEQSDIDLVKLQTATLESTASTHVNGHMAQTKNESPTTEVSVPQKLDDVILTSPTVEKRSSSTQEQSPDNKGLTSSENSCFSTPSEAKLYDIDSPRIKKVAAVQPIPQNVSLVVKVHYITHSNSQILAVIGDHEKLGEWENYVPLTSDKDGYWSHSVTLPADANIEWKFVMVENGKIKRWEECNNRHLRTAHEDAATQQWWGYP